MKIHDIPGFPNPLRVRVVLAAKGLLDKVDFVPVDLPGAEHKRPPFLAINPTGTVPVLELDDGTYISECTAITEYLDNLDGNPILTGKTALEKAMVHMMQKRAESELIDAIGIYFHHATPGLGDADRPAGTRSTVHRAHPVIRLLTYLPSTRPCRAAMAFMAC